MICTILLGCWDAAAPDPELVLEEARELIADQKHAEALRKMQALVEAHPDDSRIQTLYGEALLASGQPSLAVWPLARAMRDPEYLVHAGLLLARAQAQSGSGADAIKTATRILDAEPNNGAALMLRIHAYLGESLEERALEDIDRASELDLEQTSLDVLRLDALLGLGREEEAERLLAQLTEQAEAMRESRPADAARLCAATATFTAERGDVDGAKERFSECLEGDGVDSWVLVETAVNFFDEQGEIERGTKAIERRFEADRKHLGNRVLYADRLQKVGRFEEGEALLIEATRDQPAAWSALADLYAIESDLEKAVDALDHAIEAFPEAARDWSFTRADFLLALGRIDEAAAMAKSLEIPAQRALVEARIAFAREDFAAAAARFEEGIRLWPDNPDARYLAGQSYERLGQWSQASAHYREAARMEKPHHASSLALADLQRALGDTEGVAFLLLRLGDLRPNDPEIIEKLIEFAGDTGNDELGLSMLTRLSRMRGKAGRSVALAAERAERAEGAEAALRVIDKTGLDLLDPIHAEALEARAKLLAALDRGDEAIAQIDQVLARDPGSARLLFARAAVLRAQGDDDRATRDLEAAVEADPRFVPALLERASLAAQAGDEQRARSLYEQIVPIEAERNERGESGEQNASIALARLDLASGRAADGRARLRRVLVSRPRSGEAAWLLLQSYAEDAGGERLSSNEREDLARRAAVFTGTEEARRYFEKLTREAS